MSRLQHGHCWVEFELKERGAGYEFVNKIEDDNIIPKEYIESVNKGIQEAMQDGGYYKYPITDIKATLYDGSYWEPGASEMAYKIAGRFSIFKMTKEEERIFLEPIMKLKVELEAGEVADIINLVYNNGGKIEEEQNSIEKTIYIPLRKIIGDVPLELEKLVKQSLSMEVSHYEEVIESVQNAIIDDRTNDNSFSHTNYENILEIKTKEDNLEWKIVNEIQSYHEKLEKCLLEKDFAKRIEIQNMLGIAFQQLSHIRNQEENILKAIKVYMEGVINYNLTASNVYSSMQRNLGNAYMDLSKISDTEKNILKAIEAFKEAIRVEVSNKSTQIDLGNAYIELANLGNGDKNNLKALNAVNAFKEAFKIYENKGYIDSKSKAMEYLEIEDSIGHEYMNLLKIKDRKSNLLIVIKLLSEAINNEKKDCDSLIYVSTQNFIGLAYRNLATLENNHFLQFLSQEMKKETLLKGIEAFNLALSVNKIKPEYSYSFDYIFPFEEEYPMKYAEISKNLGQTYIDLAKLGEKEENFLKANKAFDKTLWCYREALKTKIEREYPVDYKIIQNYIDEIYKLKSQICC